ncbi:hypothetical protein RSAG8_07224, partial [Rhizoctonia solani AG-8 WAC10335]
MTHVYAMECKVDDVCDQLREQGRRLDHIPAKTRDAIQLNEIMDYMRQTREDMNTLAKDHQDSVNALMEMIQGIKTCNHEITPMTRRPESRRSTIQGEEDEQEMSFSGLAQSSRIRTKDSAPKEARAKRPEPYKGQRGTEADIFLLKMETFFKEYKDHYNDDKKISSVLNNLGEGEPNRWARPLLKRQLADEEHPYLASWEAFKRAFLLSFGDPLKTERAKREIATLRQIGSVQRYNSSFRTLSEELEWDKRALIDKYRSGLNIEVQQELLKMRLSTDMDTKTLEEIMELAIQIGDVLQQANSLRDDLQRKDSPWPDNKSTTFRTKPFTPGEPSQENYIPKETIDLRKVEYQCLKCGKSGHKIRDCLATKWLDDPVKAKVGMIGPHDNKHKESEN